MFEAAPVAFRYEVGCIDDDGVEQVSGSGGRSPGPGQVDRVQVEAVPELPNRDLFDAPLRSGKVPEGLGQDPSSGLGNDS